jgi:hypothetical protein
MLRMCVYMHSRFVENHPIRILEDGLLISEVVLSHGSRVGTTKATQFCLDLVFLPQELVRNGSD